MVASAEADVDREIALIAIAINVAVICGGVLIILMAMFQRGRAREMQHRERLAMIERGLAPSPEQNPAAFDDPDPPRRHPPSTGIGIVIAAIGFGLILLIGVTANAMDVAVGVGGAIVVLGAAFITLGELQRRSRALPRRSHSAPPASHPSDSPGSP
jgi:hypothetical protein